MPDLVGNPEDRFSCIAAHFIVRERGDLVLERLTPNEQVRVWNPAGYRVVSKLYFLSEVLLNTQEAVAPF